jgi:Spy/CpxP family protein refolding chaperone
MKKITLTILAATLLTSAIGFAQAPATPMAPVAPAAPTAVVAAPAPAKVVKANAKVHKASHKAQGT